MGKSLGLLVWLALVGLGGCSVQTAYNNLDRLARWSVDDYVDMNRQQRAWFDQEFRRLWEWHRREHLPQYADFLEEAAGRLDERLDEAYLQSAVDRVSQWLREIEDRGMPIAAELLASLSDAQLAHLAEALERSNRELAEPELGAEPAAAQAAWRDEFADRFRRFSGRLNPVQTLYLDAQAERYRPELVLWAEYRRRWQRDFLARLARRGDVDALERDLRRLAAERQRYYGFELIEIDAHNERLAREISTWLVESLTDRQRARFQERLLELAGDLRQLAAAPARTRAAEPVCLLRCSEAGG